MKKLKEFWKTLPETVTVTRLDGILIVTICALAGVIIGMLCSPRKTISIGCGNEANEIHGLGGEDVSDEQIEEEDIWEDDEDVLTFN